MQPLSRSVRTVTGFRQDLSKLFMSEGRQIMAGITLDPKISSMLAWFPVYGVRKIAFFLNSDIFEENIEGKAFRSIGRTLAHS